MTAFRSAASRLDRWVFDRRFDVVSLSSGMKCRRGLGKELYVCSFGVWVYRGGCCLDNHERFFDVFLSSVATSFFGCRQTCRRSFRLVVKYREPHVGRVFLSFILLLFSLSEILIFCVTFCPVFALVADLFSFFSAYGRNVWADIAVTLCFSAVFRRGTSGPL